jgi:PIN domain nuclease of toxin-antitoxin system
VIYLDTHSAIWIRKGDYTAFEKRTRLAIEQEDDLLISPMAVLEIQLLYERQRIHFPADDVLRDLNGIAGVRVCDYPFGLVIDSALKENWTRDPFDRIITAHARARNATLITHDALIRENYKLAVW